MVVCWVSGEKAVPGCQREFPVPRKDSGHTGLTSRHEDGKNMSANVTSTITGTAQIPRHMAVLAQDIKTKQ